MPPATAVACIQIPRPGWKPKLSIDLVIDVDIRTREIPVESQLHSSGVRQILASVRMPRFMKENGRCVDGSSGILTKVNETEISEVHEDSIRRGCRYVDYT